MNTVAPTLKRKRLFSTLMHTTMHYIMRLRSKYCHFRPFGPVNSEFFNWNRPYKLKNVSPPSI